MGAERNVPDNISVIRPGISVGTERRPLTTAQQQTLASLRNSYDLFKTDNMLEVKRLKIEQQADLLKGYRRSKPEAFLGKVKKVFDTTEKKIEEKEGLANYYDGLITSVDRGDIQPSIGHLVVQIDEALIHIQSKVLLLGDRDRWISQAQQNLAPLSKLHPLKAQALERKLAKMIDNPRSKK
jgi:hypothetical protein